MRLLLFNLVTDLDDPILGFTTRWIRALAKRVEFIHVITMRAGRVEVPDNVQVYSVGKEKGYSEPRRAMEFYRHLLHVLQNDTIDVCFAHMMPVFTLLAGPVLKAKGIPIVTWYAHPKLTFRLKLAHFFSDRMVASLATAYPYKHNKLIVVGQGIDTDLFSSDGHMTPDDPPMILSVGRLSPVKDHLTLLRAVSLLKQQWGKSFQVVILGGPGGPQDEVYVQALHEQVKELELQDSVSLEPPVPMASLPPWYWRCTVHVNLTPTGFGDKVAWEAMACGRPCLVANEGFRETLGEHASHLLFRYGDGESLAKKLTALLEKSGTEKKGIGLYLRERVTQMHSLNRLAGQLANVFSEVQGCRG